MLKKTAPTSTKKHMTKAAFVRSLPATMSAAQVVAEAHKAGIKISAAHVYVIRSNANKSGKKTNGRARRSSGRPAVATGNRDGLEQQLEALIMDLGFARAEQLLGSIRRAARR
jgi:uncharacterized lipoprotein YddW (UPF0748 family)